MNVTFELKVPEGPNTQFPSISLLITLQNPAVLKERIQFRYQN